MSQNISKEALKAALLDLVQSDKVFVSSLLAELAMHLPHKPLTAPVSRRPRSAAKKTAGKIVPAYRQNVKKAYPQAGLSEAAAKGLQELFADAPPVEQMLKMLHK